MDKYGQQWTTTRSAKGISVFYLYLYILFQPYTFPPGIHRRISCILEEQMKSVVMVC